MTENLLISAAMVFVGLIVGIGMVLVRPTPGEPEELQKIWPLARFYRYKSARLTFALLGFAFALIGALQMAGWF
jgi:hypothetical protein